VDVAGTQVVDRAVGLGGDESLDDTGPATTAARGPALLQRYLRGSSLLLAGRLIAVVLNFTVQVLTVRYLAKDDYGAFAFGLSMASLATSLSMLGLGKSVPRLVALHHERNDEPRAFGIIAIALATVWTVGLTIVVGVHLFQGAIGTSLVTDRESLVLLLLLVALAPLDACDHLLQQLTAVFSGPKRIFLRRQVVGPSLKLASILAVIATSGGAYLLAWGYLVGSVVGVGLYAAGLIRAWHAQGYLTRRRLSGLVFPVREVRDFSLPLLSSEMAVMLRGTAAVAVLEYLRVPADVAEYRAVLPVAGLNMLVADAFGFLFVPVASRMLARQDAKGINQLYWQTSLWIAVLTFPIFAVTCALAGPLAVTFFGQDYASATMLLAVLAIGYYLNAALGFNAATLRVHGRLRTIVVNDCIAAVACVVMSVVFIRAYGGLGAAMATAGTLVLQNLLNHFGLWWTATGIHLFTWPVLRSYAVIALAMMTMVVFQWAGEPPVLASLAVVGVLFLIVVRVSRRALDAKTRFPEVYRLPYARLLFG